MSVRSASDLGIPGFETVSVLADSRGTLIRATDAETKTDVVISLLDRAREPILPKRFIRSRRELLKLTKSGVGLVPLLGSGVASDGRDYVIVPYYPIGSLQDQVAHGPTPWYLAAEMMAEVCRIVGLAHDRDVVLGDIRPSTIFLEAVGKPAVATFGVATRRFDDGGATFIAPEAAGDNPDRSSASDVYSLALVLAALIAGRPWARDESKDEFLAEVGATAPPRILDVIEHGLSVSPTNRYRDAATMRRAIRAAMEAAPDAGPITSDDEPFDFDSVFEPVESTSRNGAAAGIPLALNHETLPPGLEDIMFVHRDEDEPSDDAAADEPVGQAEFTDVSPTFADGSDPFATGELLDIHIDPDVAESESTDPGSEIDPAYLDDGFEAIDETDLDSELDSDSDSDYEDDVEVNIIGFDDDENFDEDDSIDLDGDGPERLSRAGDITPDPPQMPGAGGRGTGTSTLIRDVRSAESIEIQSDLADVSAKELAVAEAATVTADQTSILRLPEVDETDVDDQTSALDLDELANGAEDQTSVLSLDELADDRTDSDVDGGGEDQTSVLDLEELATGTNGDDQTSVLDLDELTDAEGEDQTSILNLDELDERDRTSVLSFDDLRDEAESAAREESNGAKKASILGVASDPAFENDLTDVFGDSTDRPNPDAFVPGQGSPGAYDGMLAPDGTPLEEVPFRGVNPVRKTVDSPTPLDRVRTAAEVFWFRSRRSVATSAALFGLLVIVGIVIYFLAQEVRSSSKIAAEGISQTTTTIQTNVTQLATNVPSVTAPPTQLTTTLPPRRPARAVVPPEQADADEEDGEATDGDDDAQNGSDSDRLSDDENNQDDGDSVGEGDGENGKGKNDDGDRGNGRDRDEVLPPNAGPPDDETPTTEPDGPAGPTTAPPATEAPEATEPPQVEPPETDPPETSPPTNEDEVQPPKNDDDEQPEPQRPTVSLSVGSIGKRSASVALVSDQCVAVRYVLSGDDGSTSRNQTSGYNPAAQCSNGWNFGFDGSELSEDTSYRLKVWVKALDTELTRSTEISFSTTD